MYNYQHKGYSSELFHPYFESFYDFIEKECRIISLHDDNQSIKLTFTPSFIDTTKDSFTKELFIKKQDSMVYAETWYGNNSIYGRFYNKIIINELKILRNSLDSILIENQPIEVSIIKDRLQEDKNWIAKDTAFINHKFDNIRFTNLEGKSIRLYNTQAKYYLIDFSYINCPPCLVLHQNLTKISTMLSEKNIDVITLNGIDKDVNKIKNHIAKSGTKFPTYLCTKEVLKQYNVEGYPKVFILDNEFNIIYVSSGYSNEILNQIKLLE
jgi:thioredoxin-related protein